MPRAELSLAYALIDEELERAPAVASRGNGLRVTDRSGPGLASTSGEPSKIRRIEDWIVTMLGEDAAKGGDDWEDLIGRIAPTWVPRKTRQGGSGSSKTAGGWERFRLVRRKGI